MNFDEALPETRTLVLQPRTPGKRLAARNRLRTLMTTYPGQRVGFATPDGLEIWKDGSLLETKQYGREYDRVVIDEAAT